MAKAIFTMLLLALFFISCNTDTEKPKTKNHITKIAFGSCGYQNHDLPIFNNVVNHNADFFIFLGDNIYGDTKNMDTLKFKYNLLGTKPTYQNLKKNTTILATWDDHDFGWNDAGKEYPFKEESKDIFLDFFEEPESSSRRTHKGIYHSYMYDYEENKLQIILLDGRTFRDSLLPYNGEMDHDKRFSFYGKDYAPHTTKNATLLGEDQWIWLEKELQKPADIRIIGTGTQFGIEWNGYEAWANFPYEQKRMLNLIKSTKANGVVFISGDVHYSEISKLETDFYPIYDFTSSGLSSTWHYATPNKNRIEGPVMENHFGLITIDWDKDDTNLLMETWDINNNQRFEYTVKLKSITAFDIN
ncbi:alkaline phosphatase D family protein [Gelatiniphilus marinus]|uniref:Alkaline phosphatase D family protein n=1 Tax=Gelatiniphilus marinus TaxID=1759464 RepID=A0ABW5JQP0_9FLAO